jgi:sugar phosphate isomerase/epimerase
MFEPFKNSAKTRRMFEQSHRSLEAAGRLGIPWVVFHPETCGGGWDAAHLRRLRQRNLDWLGPLVETAGRFGTGIALENLLERGQDTDSRRRYCAAPAELVDLVDAFDSPRVGACWDTGHARIMRLNQGAALRALGGRLKATHVQDNDGEGDQHLLPYLGKVDWPAVMAGLRTIEYAGDFTYEIHNFVRHLPDCLRDSALRLMREMGEYLLGL